MTSLLRVVMALVYACLLWAACSQPKKGKK
jgi:hypothetical protein